MKNSLKKQIILYIAFLLIAALFLMSILVVSMMENILVQQKIDHARLLTTVLQENITLLNVLREENGERKIENRAEMDQLVKKFIGDDSFYRLIIIDKEERIVSANDPREIGAYFKNGDLQTAMATGIPNFKEENKGRLPFSRGEILIINVPLNVGNVIVGGIRGELLFFETKRIILQVRWLTLLFILIDSVIFIIFGAVILNQGVIKPLRELVFVTEKLAQGEMDQHIEFKDDNEFGILSASFNLMVERLREKTASLNKNIRLLEKSNRELVVAKNEVIRSDRLASVGRLAAGVAHEIGNPLGAMVGYLNILIRRLKSNEEEINILRRIENEIDRIDKIVRDLLNLAAPAKEDVSEEINVNELINSTVELLTYQNLWKGIEVERNLDNTLPPIVLNGHKLRQVFVNLLLNARDALPEGGKILIVSSNLPEAEKIKIVFSDTGIGIAEEDMGKIFDPFFTTKEMGKGTGLGLSICYRIIEDFGGKINVHSKKGEGASFEILLPSRKGDK